MPLQVEILYNEYNFVAAFAVAALLVLLALVTLAVKALVEWRSTATNPPTPAKARRSPMTVRIAGLSPAFRQ